MVTEIGSSIARMCRSDLAARPEVHMIFCWAGSAAFLAARAAAEGGAAWLRTDWRVISPLSVAFALSVRARHRNDPCLELASSQ